MDRREFLRRALSLAPAALIAVPAVTYFLPPRGGWLSREDIDRWFRACEEIIQREVQRAINPELVMWGDRTMYAEFNFRAFNEATAQYVEAVKRMPRRKWFKLEVAHG